MKAQGLIFIFLFLFSTAIQAQEDLLDSLENSVPVKEEKVIGTFKGTRLINLHTVETLGKGSLDFRISHRFGDFSSGADNLWGLDGPAAIKFGFDYSISNRLVAGIGRSSYGKLYDGYLKYKVLEQSLDGKMPLSLCAIASINLTAVKDPSERYAKFTHRLSYFYQLLFARKVTKSLSLQISPIMVHYNLVELADEKNDIFALAASGRYKLSRSFSITGEYIYRVNNYSPISDLFHNSASIGMDIETGGHVFQLFVTNSFAINEVQLIPYTASNWTKGQVRFGFNISRVFGIASHAKAEKTKKKKQW